MKHGELPHYLGHYTVVCKEMMLYQYLPIKLSNSTNPVYEERLQFLNTLIGSICCDFVGVYGLDRFVQSYIYLTAKHQYQDSTCYFNRTGYHTDGFGSDDVSYIWYDKSPTIFNKTNFELSEDDSQSIVEMETQAKIENEVVYPENSLLRINQYNVHKVNDRGYKGMRTFVKLSFSLDKYNLIGNSHNYLLDYNWNMNARKTERNIPSVQNQTLTTSK